MVMSGVGPAGRRSTQVQSLSELTRRLGARWRGVSRRGEGTHEDRAKGTETKCFTYIPLESPSPAEHGYVFGETLSTRLVRLDGDLAEFMGVIGARGEPGTECN